MEYDVVVAGAGPSGSVISYLLAKKGYNVCLIDKECFPREKACGGGITPRCVKLLDELGLLNKIGNSILNRFTGFLLVSPSGYIARCTFENIKALPDYGILVSRKLFDNELKKIAESANARFLKAEFLRPLFSGDKVTGAIINLENEEKILKCRILIIATGNNFKVLKTLFNEDIFKTKLVARQTFSEVKNVSKEFMEFYYTKTTSPGYVWIFPANGNKANIGFADNKSTGTKITENFKDIVISNKILKDKFDNFPEKFNTAVIPIRNKEKPVGNGFLLIGDAAGLAHPLTGEGIYHAIESARIAAEVCITTLSKNSGFGKKESKNYEVLLNEKFENEYRFYKKIKPLLKPYIIDIGIKICSTDEKKLNHLINIACGIYDKTFLSKLLY